MVVWVCNRTPVQLMRMTSRQSRGATYAVRMLVVRIHSDQQAVRCGADAGCGIHSESQATRSISFAASVLGGYSASNAALRHSGACAAVMDSMVVVAGVRLS